MIKLTREEIVDYINHFSHDDLKSIFEQLLLRNQSDKFWNHVSALVRSKRRKNSGPKLVAVNDDKVVPYWVVKSLYESGIMPHSSRIIFLASTNEKSTTKDILEMIVEESEEAPFFAFCLEKLPINLKRQINTIMSMADFKLSSMWSTKHQKFMKVWMPRKGTTGMSYIERSMNFRLRLNSALKKAQEEMFSLDVLI